MKDFYEREIQVGDICAFWNGNYLDSRPIWGYEGDSVEIADYHKTLIKKAKEVIDITAIERQIHSETFINSVKARDVKPDSTVVASIIPNQISYTEAAKMFDSLKAMFPNNEVSMVMGVDVTVEN
jgi:hypothetical protein